MAAEVEARTIGAPATPNELDAGRSYDKAPLFGIPKLTSFPFTGKAAIVYWDTGPIRAGRRRRRGDAAHDGDPAAAAHVRRRPTLDAALDEDRAHAEVRLAAGERVAGRRLRRRAVPQRELGARTVGVGVGRLGRTRSRGGVVGTRALASPTPYSYSSEITTAVRPRPHATGARRVTV